MLDLINGAPKMPLSSTVRLEKDEVVELLEEAIARLPEEMRQARWLLKERAEYLAKVQREADDILAAARERAERIVQRTELVREAQRVARRTVEEANDESRRLRHEAEDYCDQKLASFETVLERITKTVAAGRPEAAGDARCPRPRRATRRCGPRASPTPARCSSTRTSGEEPLPPCGPSSSTSPISSTARRPAAGSG